MIEHIFAVSSDKGEILLYDATDKFIASLQNGAWFTGDVFHYLDLEENFFHIKDDDEVLRLLAEAREALRQPLPSVSD